MHTRVERANSRSLSFPGRGWPLFSTTGNDSEAESVRYRGPAPAAVGRPGGRSALRGGAGGSMRGCVRVRSWLLSAGLRGPELGLWPLASAVTPRRWWWGCVPGVREGPLQLVRVREGWTVWFHPSPRFAHVPSCPSHRCHVCHVRCRPVRSALPSHYSPVGRSSCGRQDSDRRPAARDRTPPCGWHEPAVRSPPRPVDQRLRTLDELALPDPDPNDRCPIHAVESARCGEFDLRSCLASSDPVTEWGSGVGALRRIKRGTGAVDKSNTDIHTQFWGL